MYQWGVFLGLLESQLKFHHQFGLLAFLQSAHEILPPSPTMLRKLWTAPNQSSQYENTNGAPQLMVHAVKKQSMHYTLSSASSIHYTYSSTNQEIFDYKEFHYTKEAIMCYHQIDMPLSAAKMNETQRTG